MKFLALLFLAGLALASAVPVLPEEYAVEEYAQALEDIPLELIFEADDENTRTEFGRILRERFNEILEKIKEAIEQGKIVKEDLIAKLKEIRSRLRDLRIKLGEKGRKLIEELKEKTKDYWKKVLDNLNPDKGSDSEVFYANVEDELVKKLRERFLVILEKVKDSIERNKVVKEEYIEKLREIRGKLKERGVDLGQKIKEFIERLKEKGKEYWKKIFEKLNPDRESALYADNDIKTELGRKLKERFEEILEKVKDAIEKGKVVKGEFIEKLKEIREKLRDLRVELGQKARELIERLKEKGKDYFKKILDELTPKDQNVLYADDEVESELGRKLRERFLDILERIKDSIEKGKVVEEKYIEKLKEIRDKLKERGLELGQKIREFIERLKERARDYWKKILDRLNPDRESALYADNDVKTEIETGLRKILDEILAKLREAIEKGEGIEEYTVEELREIREKLQDLRANLSERVKAFIERVKKNAKDFWKNILDKLRNLGIDIHVGYSATNVESNDVKTEIETGLRKVLDEILEKLREAIEKGEGIEEYTVEELREIREKLEDLRANLSERVKAFIERVKKNVKDFWKNLLDKLRNLGIDIHVGNSSTGGEEPKTVLGRTLKEHLDEILEKIKEAIESGKGVKEETLEKLREVREKLKEARIDLSNKAKELFRNIKDIGKEYFQKILEQLGLHKRALDFYMEDQYYY